MPTRREALIDGPAGALEAVFEHEGEELPGRVAVVCHPHPLHGGTLHTTVVHRMAKGLRRARVATLRFNFRGVGRSTGTHDDGKGELEDVKAALDHVLAQGEAQDVIIAGFSFGARVGLQVGVDDERVTHLVGVGLPLQRTSFAFLEACVKPKLLIQGERDEYGDGEEFTAFTSRVAPPLKSVVIPEATHLFAHLAPAVEDAVARYFAVEDA